MPSALVLYEPLNVLKPVAPDIWVADGPEILFGYLGVKLPFPTRMTVVRLREGGLFVHSPIPPDPALVKAVAALGPVRYIVAPNTIHYWWAPDWQALYPEARLFAVPGLARKAKRPMRVDADLGNAPPPEWADEIDQILFVGDIVSEAVFFHCASRTVILTDLIENFEPARIKSRWFRFLVKLFHAADPNGSAPYDMRATFLSRRERLRDGVRRMFAWRAERVILAHGRWYARNGDAELRRAFAWAV